MMSPVIQQLWMRPDSSCGMWLNCRLSSSRDLLGPAKESPMIAPNSTTPPRLWMLLPLRFSLVSVLFLCSIFAIASAPSFPTRFPDRFNTLITLFVLRASANAVAPLSPMNPGSAKQSSRTSRHHPFPANAAAIDTASESVHCISNATFPFCIFLSVRLKGCLSHMRGTRENPKSTNVEGSSCDISSPTALRGLACSSLRIAHSRRRALPAMMRRDTARLRTLSHRSASAWSSALKCSVRTTSSLSG
mmetsp:Transcript_38465/g.78839  ORF Transcript_38465/g.78839 Transcript_38465/m.78839 type:complete len:247 (-) Transcript_38465:1643-2383(-)